MSDDIKVGDVVRVKEPDEFLAAFAAKIKDRDAQVLWVGPDKHGQFKGKCGLLFKKRNGRGKEFKEIMHTRHLIKKDEGEKKQ